VPVPGKDAAEKPKPPKPSTYYIRTELTRTYATVSQSMATRITEDLDQLFTE